MVPFPVTYSDPQPRFQGHWAIIDALYVLCAQLTRDLFAIANLLFLMFVHTTVSKKALPDFVAWGIY